MPPDPAIASEPVQTPPTCAAPLAHFVAWLIAGLVNAVYVAALPMPASGLGTRALHHLYDLGHFVAAGALTSLALLGWRRFAPVGALWRLLGAGTIAMVVGSFLLPEDLVGLTRRVPGSKNFALAYLVLGVSASVPLAALAGSVAGGRVRARLPSRAIPWLRWVAVFAAVVALALNNRVLPGEHQSGHLFATWSAVTLLGSALTGLPIPALGARIGRRTRQGLAAAVGLLAAWSVVVAPGQTVTVQLSLLDGSVLMSPLSRVRSVFHSEDAFNVTVPRQFQQWFTNRNDYAAIDPTDPPLLPPADLIVALITIDSLRTEPLTQDEYKTKLPRLWELKQRGIYFSEARSPGAGTRRTLGSIFTGKHVSQLNWRFAKGFAYTLKDDNTPQFAADLSKAGVATEHAVSYKNLAKRYQVLRGFEREHRVETPPGQKFPLSAQLLEPLRERLRTDPSGPLFFFAHLMEPHQPYRAAGVGGDVLTRWLASAAMCDAEIGKLMDLVDAEGLSDRFVLIVSADHGEGLGDHNTKFHQSTVYDELVHVPLLVVAPGIVPRVIDDHVTLLDIGPTALDLFGLPTPGWHMGQSLVPYLRGDDPRLTRPIAGVAKRGKSPVYYLMLPQRGYKVIWNTKFGTHEIYDLRADPNEQTNLYDSLGEEATEHINLLKAFFERHSDDKGKAGAKKKSRKKKKKKGKKKKRKGKGKRRKPKRKSEPSKAASADAGEEAKPPPDPSRMTPWG